MISRVTGALMRAILVSLLIATPALLMPGVAADSTQIVAFIAILAAVLTFVEYSSAYPSFVEFRDAPPFNRLRFVSLFLTVFLLTVIMRGKTNPNDLTILVTLVGDIVGRAIDFPYSPVRLVLLMLPEDSPETVVATVRTAAGMSYLVALSAMVVFVVMVRIFHWPARNGAFNVWVNLPLFDPTAGGDVLNRLTRDARINITLGFLLPFLIPAVVKAASEMVGPVTLNDPQTLIWTMTAWAFLPASMIMRGIAMGRVAEMIEEKRRRAYAESASLQTA